MKFSQEVNSFWRGWLAIPGEPAEQWRKGSIFRKLRNEQAAGASFN
jgi:hypothetical protein